MSNIGALRIRIGSWGPFTTIIIRNPQNSIGSYSGSYSNASGLALRWLGNVGVGVFLVLNVGFRAEAVQGPALGKETQHAVP